MERDAWPLHACVIELMRAGLSYVEAWHVSPADTRRLLALRAADAIPPDMRAPSVVMGDAEAAREAFRNF